MTQSQRDAVVVGGGLAGLCCARELQAGGLDVLVLEAGAAVGGRVQTEIRDGFQLDRGFQVLLTAYPEARRVLDYDALELRTFRPGARIRRGGRFVEVADPLRRPWDGMKSLFAPLGTCGDKLRMLKLRGDVQRGDLADLFAHEEVSTQDALEARGFSSDMIESFFRPWLSGVFLEGDLATSSRMFEFVFRMFAEGDAALPAAGMAAIPRQIAEGLAPDTVRVNTPVRAAETGRVTLDGGETIEAHAVIVATDGPRAAELLSGVSRPASCGVTCLYFAAERDPVGEPLLVLDGEGAGPVNNLCVPSVVQPTYAPPGAFLISASVLGNGNVRAHELEDAVRTQMSGWFGAQVATWRHLVTYRIEHALPGQAVPALSAPERPVLHAPGLFVCGDHRDTASIQGAMASGRRCARAAMEHAGGGA